MLKLFDPDDVRPGESTSGIIHRCDFCDRRGRWTDDWTWYGSAHDEDDGVVLKTCGCHVPTEAEAEGLLVTKRIEAGFSPQRSNRRRRYGYLK